MIPQRSASVSSCMFRAAKLGGFIGHLALVFADSCSPTNHAKGLVGFVQMYVKSELVAALQAE